MAQVFNGKSIHHLITWMVDNNRTVYDSFCKLLDQTIALRWPLLALRQMTGLFSTTKVKSAKRATLLNIVFHITIERASPIVIAWAETRQSYCQNRWYWIWCRIPHEKFSTSRIIVQDLYQHLDILTFILRSLGALNPPDGISTNKKVPLFKIGMKAFYGSRFRFSVGIPT